MKYALLSTVPIIFRMVITMSWYRYLKIDLLVCCQEVWTRQYRLLNELWWIGRTLSQQKQNFKISFLIVPFHKPTKAFAYCVPQFYFCCCCWWSWLSSVLYSVPQSFNDHDSVPHPNCSWSWFCTSLLLGLIQQGRIEQIGIQIFHEWSAKSKLAWI